MASKKPEAWNNFSVRRSSFRFFSLFYKHKFSKLNKIWQRRRINKRKKTTAIDMIRKFCNEEFGPEIQGMSESEFGLFEQALLKVMHSNRYKKGDSFLKGINFSVIRDVLYSYSELARENFMLDKNLSLLFKHFYACGSQFIASKVQGKPDGYVLELENELRFLHEEALKKLSTES